MSSPKQQEKEEEEKQMQKETCCEVCIEEEESEKVCKICFLEEDEDGNTLLNMQVCPCKGTAKYVHEKCLIKWFEYTGQRLCPTCKLEVSCKEQLKPWRQWNWEPIMELVKIVLVTFLFISLLESMIILFIAMSKVSIFTPIELLHQILNEFFECIYRGGWC